MIHIVTYMLRKSNYIVVHVGWNKWRCIRVYRYMDEVAEQVGSCLGCHGFESLTV